MREAVIVAAKRTAFGKYAGQLKHLEPEQYYFHYFNFIRINISIYGHIQDVIIGNTVGNGGNVARKSLLTANLEYGIPGLTLDRQWWFGVGKCHLCMSDDSMWCRVSLSSWWR